MQHVMHTGYHKPEFVLAAVATAMYGKHMPECILKVRACCGWSCDVCALRVDKVHLAVVMNVVVQPCCAVSSCTTVVVQHGTTGTAR